MPQHLLEAVPFDQARQTIQPSIGTRSLRQKRFNKARLPSPLHCHLHPLKSRLAGNHNHPILQQARKGRGSPVAFAAHFTAPTTKVRYAAATVRLAPSACTIRTRLPAGASGPATRQIVSSIRTVPAPSMIGFSSVNTRPTNASARLLRNGLLSRTVKLLRARRRHSGTAAAAKTANIRIWTCQDGLNANDKSPTSKAASPSQNRKMPGANSSSAIRMTPKISRFQVPSVENISVMVRPLQSTLLLVAPHRKCPPSPVGRGLG